MKDGPFIVFMLYEGMRSCPQEEISSRDREIFVEMYKVGVKNVLRKMKCIIAFNCLIPKIKQKCQIAQIDKNASVFLDYLKINNSMFSTI